jgi:hypothetical protein
MTLPEQFAGKAQSRSHIITERADNLTDTQVLNFLQKVASWLSSLVYLHKPKMQPNHISIICTRPLGRIDNVALKRWALFTVE